MYSRRRVMGFALLQSQAYIPGRTTRPLRRWRAHTSSLPLTIIHHGAHTTAQAQPEQPVQHRIATSPATMTFARRRILNPSDPLFIPGS